MNVSLDVVGTLVGPGVEGEEAVWVGILLAAAAANLRLPEGSCSFVVYSYQFRTHQVALHVTDEGMDQYFK